jgi:transposase
MEVVDTGRRRRWSDAEKLRIVEESYRGHRQVSATARRHGMSTSQLYRWRRDIRAGRLGGETAPSFVEAKLVDLPKSSEQTGQAGLMEIVLTNGCRVTVGPDVDADALGRVLAVVAGR